MSRTIFIRVCIYMYARIYTYFMAMTLFVYVCECVYVVYIQRVDKTIETEINWGITFVCVGYIEKTSVGNTECFSVRLQSIAFVIVH
jgi:hypothetical protein